jgi:hypothetical protein
MAELTGDWHLLNVGYLVVTLQSIEYSARVAIGVLSEKRWRAPDFPRLQKGDWVPEDAVTDFAPLGTVLRRFNELAPAQYRVDARRLVALRDLLAHGRLISAAAARETRNHLPLVIVKFGQVKAGRVPVIACDEMTEKWFQEQRTFLSQALYAAVLAQGPDALLGDLSRQAPQGGNDEGRRS